MILNNRNSNKIPAKILKIHCIWAIKKYKVKLSLLQVTEAHRVMRSWGLKVAERLVALQASCTLPPRNIPSTHFCEQYRKRIIMYTNTSKKSHNDYNQ
jgi:hypothetical protein